MYVVRPVEMADLPRLEQLSQRDNVRVHTLPRSRAALREQVEQSLASFARPAAMPADERYTFVLSGEDGALAGTASLVAQAGAGARFLSFRKDMMQQVSPDPQVSNNVATLMLCSDLSGYSQLAGYHAPGAALDDGHKSLLARSRLMYAALAPHRFADKFFACLPGLTDERHGSPFWDAIGRHFFRMDFLQAEALLDGQRNRALIVGLMPHYPVYLALLPPCARAALSSVDPLARAGLEMLCREGFGADDYVDICDGGPVLQASRHALRSWSASMRRRVARPAPSSSSSSSSASPAPSQAGANARYLVCNGRVDGYRAVYASCAAVEQTDSIALSPAQQKLLAIGPGDEVVCVPL